MVKRYLSALLVALAAVAIAPVLTSCGSSNTAPFRAE